MQLHTVSEKYRSLYDLSAESALYMTSELYAEIAKFIPVELNYYETENIKELRKTAAECPLFLNRNGEFPIKKPAKAKPKANIFQSREHILRVCQVLRDFSDLILSCQKLGLYVPPLFQLNVTLTPTSAACDSKTPLGPSFRFIIFS